MKLVQWKVMGSLSLLLMFLMLVCFEDPSMQHTDSSDWEQFSYVVRRFEMIVVRNNRSRRGELTPLPSKPSMSSGSTDINLLNIHRVHSQLASQNIATDVDGCAPTIPAICGELFHLDGGCTSL